jgi:hypothetical protein
MRIAASGFSFALPQLSVPNPQTQTDRRQARIRRISREALRRARGLDGWRAYEAAKGYVRREYGAHIPGYDAVLRRIIDELNL